METTDNKDIQGGRAYRFMIPFSDTVDMAKKILLMYNGYLSATGKKSIIDARHLNLLAFYFCFGYSYDTKEKFAHCFSVSMQYVSVLDNEMKKRGVLYDKGGNFKTRGLSRDIENMRRLFILEGSKDKNAIVSLFYRDESLDEKE